MSDAPGEIQKTPVPMEGVVRKEEKTEVQKLSERIGALFSLVTQETITEESLSSIQSLKEGWKKEFLHSYNEDNLVACAQLLEEAIDDCVKTAKESKETQESPFLQKIKDLGDTEKMMLVSLLSKNVQVSPWVPTITAASGAALVTTTRMIGAGIGAQSLSGLAARFFVAAANIPCKPHLMQLIGLAHDALNKNPWPAVAGATAAFATYATLSGISFMIPPTAPFLVPAAANISLQVGATAMNLVRAEQLLSRRRRIAQPKKGTKLKQIKTEGKHKIKVTEKHLPAAKKRALEQVDIIMKKTSDSDQKKEWEAKRKSILAEIEKDEKDDI